MPTKCAYSFCVSVRMLLIFNVRRDPVLVLRPEKALPGIRIKFIAATNPVPTL